MQERYLFTYFAQSKGTAKNKGKKKKTKRKPTEKKNKKMEKGKKNSFFGFFFSVLFGKNHLKNARKEVICSFLFVFFLSLPFSVLLFPLLLFRFLNHFFYRLGTLLTIAKFHKFEYLQEIVESVLKAE